MTKFSIAYTPGYKPEGCGTKSQRHWTRMRGEQINKLFNCSPNEYVAGLVVTEEGITASIEYMHKCSLCSALQETKDMCSKCGSTYFEY